MPERLVLADDSRAAAPGTLICSSTSGLRPTLLQAKTTLTGCSLRTRFSLCTCCHSWSCAQVIERIQMHSSGGCYLQGNWDAPSYLRKEVDGFIANRLQEAVSREALWVAHDDLGTL